MERRGEERRGERERERDERDERERERVERRSRKVYNDQSVMHKRRDDENVEETQQHNKRPKTLIKSFFSFVQMRGASVEFCLL